MPPIKADRILYDDPMREVMRLAKLEAGRTRHAQLCGAHYLLGLIRHGQGRWRQMLETRGVDLERLKEALERQLPPSAEQAAQVLMFGSSEDARRVMDEAKSVAEAMGRDRIGIDDMLLACLRVKDAPPGACLAEAGLTYEDLAQEIGQGRPVPPPGNGSASRAAAAATQAEPGQAEPASRPRGDLCAVTGAGGFIGHHLVALLLKHGWRVRALVHYNALGRRGHLEGLEQSGREMDADWWRAGRLSIAAGDMQDPRCVRELVADCDVVFHLAALIGIPYSYMAPQSYLNVNVQGTLNMLEACRDAEVGRLLVTSTSEAYGTARRVPIDEDHPLTAQSPYAASKIAADKLAESYCLSFEMPVVTVRPFNAYGPRQSARAVIPTIVGQALDPACKAIRLGSLAPVRDLSFVMDTARAFLALATAPADRVVGRVFNVATGEGVSIGDLAKIIQRLAGSNKPVVQDERRMRPEASEVQRLIGDAGRLRAATDWRPEVSLEAGLARVVAWARKSLPSLRAGDYIR